MKIVLPFLFLPPSWTSFLPPRDLVLPNLNLTLADAQSGPNQLPDNRTGSGSGLRDVLSPKCDWAAGPVMAWTSCYNAWKKTFELADRQEKTNFIARHHRPTPPVTAV